MSQVSGTKIERIKILCGIMLIEQISEMSTNIDVFYAEKHGEAESQK